ncbi:MAG: hypothetical protein AAF357_19365 [Verrucomicrobiota bacterium]
MAFWIDYSSPSPHLEPLLYRARFLAWLIALPVAVAAFTPFLLRRRMGVAGAIRLSVLALVIYYPCDGFLTAMAEQEAIDYHQANPDPSDDMGPHYLYGSFSPGAGGSSRGKLDAGSKALEAFQRAAVFSPFWLFVAWVAGRISFLQSPRKQTAKQGSEGKPDTVAS